MSQSSTPHEYDILQSAQAFRLLRLHPAPDFNAPVACAIETFELDGESHPPYTALSYTWGPSSRSDSISLPANNAHIAITPTLTQALRHMRRLQSTHPDLDDSTWWWIDMVCINQSSIPERTAQVSLMRTIFQTATLTTAWLGPAADDSDTLMSHLAPTTTTTPRELRAWTSSPAGKAATKAFQDRPYWQRAWVIQEVCVSPRVLLACGHRTAPWKAMDAQHKWLRQRTYPAAHDVPDLRVLRNRFQGHGGALHLGFLVYRAKAARSADPRDRVFSLLGLVTGGAGVGVVPDYALSACEVFAAAIRAAERDLDEAERERGRGRMRRADSFRKRVAVMLSEIREHPHEPLRDGGGVQAREKCDGLGCGMWELCWMFCGVALQLE